MRFDDVKVEVQIRVRVRVRVRIPVRVRVKIGVRVRKAREDFKIVRGITWPKLTAPYFVASPLNSCQTLTKSYP